MCVCVDVWNKSRLYEWAYREFLRKYALYLVSSTCNNRQIECDESFSTILYLNRQKYGYLMESMFCLY